MTLPLTTPDPTADATAEAVPQAPRVRPRVVFDHLGSYLVFPDRACAVCAVGLTSRNRYGHKLLCAEHGLQQSRQRIRKAKGSPSQTVPATKPWDAEPCPEKRNLRACFDRWLRMTTEPRIIDSLKAAMTNYELTARLRETIPAPTPEVIPSIPVEDPTFTNPEHRTTRLEFLADCEHYGV